MLISPEIVFGAIISPDEGVENEAGETEPVCLPSRSPFSNRITIWHRETARIEAEGEAKVAEETEVDSFEAGSMEYPAVLSDRIFADCCLAKVLLITMPKYICISSIQVFCTLN